MSIWFKTQNISDINRSQKDTICDTIGIEITEITEDSIKGTMPVDKRTHQPYKLLHGGASVVLAETLGSLAANLVVDYKKFVCVGLDINANHIRGISSGLVYGEAKAVHIGKSTHVWSIEIKNKEGKMICLSRITMAVIKKV